MYHKKVTKRVATNPVAKAIARARLHDALVNKKIAIYMLADGDPCADLIESIATCLAVVGMASEMDPDVGPNTPEVRVLLGGLSACNTLMEKDKWDSNQAVAIEQAIDRAELLNKRTKSIYINRAWAHVNNFNP